MLGKIHFIAGLPRAGSTLLSSLLRQNPRFTAGMTSPVGHLFNAALRETSMRNEDAAFIDNDFRERLLKGIFSVYYADATDETVTFDTNRIWPTKLSALTHLFPEARMICCVRNPAWVVDSIETLIRRNAFELSGIFNFEPGGTVYSRTDGLTGPNGMVGFAINAVREALYTQYTDRILLLQYETLVRDPMGALAGIYDFLGEDMPDTHDPNNVAPCDDMEEFDRRLGTPGLHAVGRRVAERKRETILPPDLFERYQAGAFWRDPSFRRPGLRII
ncbi:MAG: sulfotransferase [Alphaproteobacteria bacterium]|nr:sulfotransferase [Alphaproteobacteria bacterium]